MRDLVAKQNPLHAQKMVNYRRNFIPGGTYFFTVVLADRTSNTLTKNITLLRSAFRQTRNEHPFTIDAIVILPDHLHAILTLPPNDHNFPLRWRRIKTIFTQGLQTSKNTPQRDGHGRTIWQRRFWEHTIRNEPDFTRHVDYIHFNPVKHALVQTPTAWPFSSLHRYIRQGLLPPDWASPIEVSEAGFGEPTSQEQV